MKKNIIIIVLAVIVVALTVALLINYKGELGGMGTKINIDHTKLVAYIVNDSRCADCADMVDYAKLSFQQTFPGIEFKEFDYLKPDGAKFYKQYQLTTLPAILFTSAVKSEANYKNMQKFFLPNATDPELLSLNVGSTFDPTKEICDNQKDDTNNGKIDCEDPDCIGSLVCRENVANSLDLFVMSQCPYGTEALNAMKEVLSNFKDKINFKIHYIASETSSGVFDSLHGQPEVDEDIRGLCAMKYYPDNYKYMDYIWCVNAEMEKDPTNYKWENCAKNFPKIKECFSSEEGKKLLSENIKLSNELEIGASPTWIANNRYEFSGIDSETIKANFCQYNTDLSDMCANTLSTDANVSGECN
ncbi:MAG TPA: hypothetical protein PLD95_01705 [bacterium]|jgi:hypothetical protein|nr:hypothetical protein [bacterium]HOG38164.1 hypothetical protein [bacterium]HQI03384.1 hypothetical protein [bacterium]